MFCENCGKELSTEAVVCPNCGCWVNGQKERKNREIQTERKTKNVWLNVFLIATVSFVCATFVCLFGAIAGLDVYGLEYSSHERFEEGFVLGAFIMGACGLGCGITAFVLANEEEKTTKLVSLLSFIFSIGAFLSSLLFLIIGY